MTNILYLMSNNQDSPMTASFEEKSTWIQLVGMAVTLGGYLVVSGVLMNGGATTPATFTPLLVVAIVMMIVISAFGHAVAAVTSRYEERDERDRLIAWRAEAQSAWMLGVGVIVAIGCLAASMPPAWVANILILFMFLSQMLCYALKIVYQRRGV